MKFGKTLTQLAMELERQNREKKDFLIDTSLLEMKPDGDTLILDHKIELDINGIAHNQIGQNLSIPAKYYDKMLSENPSLLAENVNSWFRLDPKKRMIRTLDGTARAFLSDRYRRIDNYEIAQMVLPVLSEIPQAKIESCEITDQRMYIKVVNERLTSEVVPGDIVQSGMIITNSEVGLGSMTVQPLVYRLVCSNGMVVNDAKTRKYHAGRGNEATEDYTLYSNETLMADDKALMLKIRDTVMAVVDETKFEKVVGMMRQAKDAKITTGNIPAMVEMAGTDFGLTKKEGESVLDYLIRGGDLSLYGLANSVTRAAQDVASYDRSTAMESIGYSILGMTSKQWNKLNTIEAAA